MGTPLSPSPPTPPTSYKCAPRASRGYYLPWGLQGAGEQVVALSPRKVHRAVGLWTATAVGLFPSPSPVAACPRTPAEFHGLTLWSHSFASIRFHVLLNSLFKVLFNFPSRYLFAIGLVPVFSLRWSIPPTLGCIPKQPDSRDTNTRDGGQASYGPITRYG